MPAAPPLTVFAPVEDGYIVAFADDGHPLGQVLRAIAALDPWQRVRLPHERCWWISDDAITRLAKRLPAVSDALDQWRRHAANPSASSFTFSTSFTGFTYDAGPARSWRYVPASVASAYLRLGLAPGAPRDQVVARRRALARAHHPDVGGDHAAMVAINAATDTVLDWLARESPVAVADPV